MSLISQVRPGMEQVMIYLQDEAIRASWMDDEGLDERLEEGSHKASEEGSDKAYNDKTLQAVLPKRKKQ